MDNGMPPTLEGLLEATGLKPSACCCEVCRRQCSETMCLGTPEDIVRLINAGYAVLLRRLSVRVVLVNMQRILNIGMVQLMSDSAGCALYKDGRCLVHDLGLKPTEGRYFIHPRSKAGEALMGTLTLAVVLEWIEDKNRMAAGYCFSKVTAG